MVKMKDAESLRVVKNTGIIMSGDIINKIITFFLTIFITRLLGVEEFGLFSFALGFGAIFVIFSDLGISNYLRREIARNKKQANAYVSNALLIKVWLSLLTIASTIAVAESVRT